MEYVPWILSAWTMLTTFLLTEKRRSGTISGLVSQLLWLAFDYHVGAWGLMPLSLFLGAIYIRGWVRMGRAHD